jgi:hypothetical protein
MRRTLLGAVVLLALGVTEPALAAKAGKPIPLGRTPGSDYLELKRGHGRAAVTKQGALAIVVRRGRVRVVDRPGGERPRASCNRTGKRVSSTTVQYRGRDVRCLVRGTGPWQVIIKGSGISASGRVKGSLTLNAAADKPRGRYRVGQSGPYKRWPRAAQTYNVAR